jgi:hypothetical protein
MGLLDNPIFKHIISIGYEFETHDISKLSMTDDSFVVSNISMQGLKDRVESKKAVQLDTHSYLIDERNEYIDDPDMDGDQVNKDIMMHTTVDFGEDNFDSTLLPHCRNLPDKNKMYAFKLSRKTYPIHFTGNLKDLSLFPCSNFSGVEWIVTYYKPPSSASIILNTYADACSRITNQLDECEKKTGSFLIKHTKELVGYKYRHIYHKPNSNLYFLQINDALNSPVRRNNFTTNEITIVPQMTFCVNAVHAMQVMKEMISIRPKVETPMTQTLTKLKDEFILVYDCSTLLFPMAKTNKVLKAICLLGLILYKIVVYVNRFSVGVIKEDDYFKDDLTFSVRHSNIVLYNRLKQLLKELKLTIKEVLNLDVIERLYDKPLPVKTLTAVDKFGDPTVSFLSYFDYLEQNNTDWFDDKEIVQFSAMYKFEKDNLMIEHREFGPTIATMMIDRNIPVKSYAPKVSMLKQFNSSLISEKHVIDRTNKIFNSKSSRYTKKCKPGQLRNEKFVCTKKLKLVSKVE